MEGGISAPFIRRPIATSLLMVGLLFVGLVAYPKLPVAPLPQVDFPTIQVSASLPGADPETMASAVAQPLMLGHGTGSEIRQPLGYSMVGGLIFSQALTLFTTPVVYLYLDRVSEWIARWRGVDYRTSADPHPAE